VGQIGGYRDLIAWQKGMDLVEGVYRLSAAFPREERFGLTEQVRRAAVSVPSNIAEGYAHASRAEYVHFLDIARGSANEVETQLLIAGRLGYVDDRRLVAAMDLVREEQRILQGLVDSVRRSPKRSFRQEG
jgi:four helix bundle protein